ncbi:MAG: AzlD domain-containing protein [Synergistaceae bacterium]|nr:AzlD domain-containing protein [Synergistaceae bacterium]
MNFFFVALAVSLGSLIVKGLFTCFVPHSRLPKALDRILRFIPPAALAALVAPAIFYAKTASGSVFSPARLAAGLGALAIAVYSRNVIVTIVSGMALLLLLQMVLG